MIYLLKELTKNTVGIILYNMIVYGKDLTEKHGLVRAGVIPYTVYRNQMYFLLGVDRMTKDLSDYGGGVKIGETLVAAAARELSEELCKMLDPFVTNDILEECPVVTNPDRNTAIFFLRINSKWLNRAEQEFPIKQRELYYDSKYHELCGIKWVKDEEFRVIAFNSRSRCMWKRIQKILRYNTTWNELRKTLQALESEIPMVTKQSWRSTGKFHVAVKA